MNSLRSNSKSLSTIAIFNLKSCDLRDFSVLTYDHALSLYLCNLFSEGGHDIIVSQITCKKARIWTSFDWVGNNTDDLRCCDWPKCRHPLVVVNFSLHFCLRNEQRIHTRVRYQISAGSVFLNLKNV